MAGKQRLEVQALLPAFVVRKDQHRSKSTRGVIAPDLSRRFSKQNYAMMQQSFVMQRLMECRTHCECSA
jgi:hypothetical protein